MPQNLSVNTGLPIAPETKDPDLFKELNRVYMAVNSLAVAIDAYTGANQADPDIWNQLVPLDTLRLQYLTRLYLPFGEDIPVGHIVTIVDNAGDPLVMKSFPGVGDPRGYCNVLAGVLNGQYGEIILMGLHPFVSGLTPGATYYQSAITPGGITLVSGTPIVGWAINATSLWFNPSA